jgi:hypothetical protein
MLAALSEISDGYNEPTVTWLYRTHSEQTHRQPAWSTWSPVGRLIALQRVAAVREVALTLNPDRPLSPSSELDSIEVGPAYKDLMGSYPPAD